MALMNHYRGQSSVMEEDKEVHGGHYITAELGCGDASESGDCPHLPYGLETAEWVGAFPRAFRWMVALTVS